MSMTPEQWRRLQALFEAAVELDAEERDDYLQEHCDEPELREQVLSLLSAAEQADEGIQRVIAAALPRSMQSGERVGPYRLVEQIGEGGMGSVFLAERDDSEYKQQVAIKVIHAGSLDKAILGRFRSERQILARLNHPNIARLLDGGTTEQHYPFLVMEYVEGVPLDEYCDARQLSTSERLRLFQRVCEAIHYAHQNLVVHRDIKPGNILVTPYGQPKLLDFGIAKLLDEAPGDHTVALTRANMRVMTPEQASPEQILGKPISTASDVYSLGVLLFALLTGQRPYRLDSHRPGELERVIVETEPDRPSAAVSRSLNKPASEHGESDAISISLARGTTPDRLKRHLSGDLDNIVLMAMRKEPERRYASAQELADDIGRFLGNQPVIARADTGAYRTRKFLRRNLRAVIAAALVLVTIAGLVSVYTLRLSAERDRVRFEAQRATQTADFLRSLFTVADPAVSKGETITARELLKQGADKVSQELGEQPELQASLLTVIGSVMIELNLFEDSLRALEQAYALRRAELGNEHIDVAETAGFLATATYSLGQYNRAIEFHREAVRIRLAEHGENHVDVATAINNFGHTLYEQGDYAGAEQRYRRSLAIHDRLENNWHPNYAASLMNLAQLKQTTGDYEESEILFREALAINREQLGLQHPEVATNLHNLGSLLGVMGRHPEAQTYFEESMSLTQQLHGVDADLGSTLVNIGLMRQQQGDHNAAEGYFRRALENDQRIFGETHFNVGYDMVLIARVLTTRGEYQSAEALFQQALAIYDEALLEDNPFVASALAGLGALYVEQERPRLCENSALDIITLSDRRCDQ